MIPKLFKNGRIPASFCLLSSFQTNNTVFTRNKYEKYQVHIWRRDLNPRPLKHESSPITTIPGLPPKNIEFWKFELFWCWLKAFWGPSHFLKNCFPTNQSDTQCDQIWQIFANFAKIKKYLALYLRFIWHLTKLRTHFWTMRLVNCHRSK